MQGCVAELSKASTAVFSISKWLKQSSQIGRSYDMSVCVCTDTFARLEHLNDFMLFNQCFWCVSVQYYTHSRSAETIFHSILLLLPLSVVVVILLFVYKAFVKNRLAIIFSTQKLHRFRCYVKKDRQTDQHSQGEGARVLTMITNTSHHSTSYEY